MRVYGSVQLGALVVYYYVFRITRKTFKENNVCIITELIKVYYCYPRSDKLSNFFVCLYFLFLFIFFFIIIITYRVVPMAKISRQWPRGP